MYSPEVVKKRLEKVRPRLELSLKEAGHWPKDKRFEFEYHSVAYVKRSIKHLHSLITEEGMLARNLKSDEQVFIRNERALAMCDFEYYCSRYAKIMHWGGNKLVNLDMNKAQRITFDQWGILEEMGRAVSVMQNKARQLGSSTLAEAAIAHRAHFYPNVYAIVGSSDPDKSAKMAQMMERIWAEAPWWMNPGITRHKAGENIKFEGRSTEVSIQHGTQYAGIARGSTPSVAHLSELVDYHNPSEIVDASLLKAMHENPWMFLVLESTSKGRNNWWHKTWLYNKEFYWKGQGRLCPIFLPWFVGEDLYPTDTWIIGHPIPKTWVPAELTVKHAKKAAAYVLANDLICRHLGADWQMPIEQMWFWETERKQAEAKDDLAKFYEEMPADDHEAFQSSGRSVFPIQIIADKREDVKPPIGVYGIIGPQAEIPAAMQPARREIDYRYKPIEVKAKWHPNQTGHQYQFVKLLADKYPSIDVVGKLLVWEFPEEGEEYGFGLDTGDGIGGDSTALEMVRKGTYWRNDAQVAEFASPYMSGLDMWPIALAVGTFYSTVVQGKLKQAKAVIECNLGSGETCLMELRKRGYTNHHVWVRYDSKRIDPSRSRKLGWYTTTWSRAMILDWFIKGVKDNWLDINSPWIIDEMADFERDEKINKLQATTGSHDDRIMSLAMVHFSLGIMDTRGQKSSLVQDRQTRLEQLGVAPKYSPGIQAMDVGASMFPGYQNDQKQEFGYENAYGIVAPVDNANDSGLDSGGVMDWLLQGEELRRNW